MISRYTHKPLDRVSTRQGSTNVEPTGLKINHYSGFTLLEMVLVLFLIGLMASATLMVTENVEDQAKYEDTKHRIEMMRKAIVGDPTRTVNGSPEISGFVADMGRLPECVAELLKRRNCADDDDLVVWDIDASTGLGFGWRGPYIQVLPEQNGDLRFRDGYGNSDDDDDIDAQDSGWAYSVSAAELSISSKGFDITSDTDDVKNEQLISADDWQVKSININFINQNTSEALPSTDFELLLRVYTSGTEYSDADDIGASGSLTFDASSAAPANGGITSKTFVFNTATEIPTLGRRAYAVVCHEIPTGTPDNYVVFDGDCSNGKPASTDIKQFIAVPRQNITLDWTIQ